MALPDFSLPVSFSKRAFTSATRPSAGTPADGTVYLTVTATAIHIIDLTQTVELLDQALQVVRETVAKGGRHPSSSAPSARRKKPVADAAERFAHSIT